MNRNFADGLLENYHLTLYVRVFLNRVFGGPLSTPLRLGRGGLVLGGEGALMPLPQYDRGRSNPAALRAQPVLGADASLKGTMTLSGAAADVSGPEDQYRSC